MRKIISFMHVSLDGFVAGPAGEMDWIHADNEMFDYAGDRTDHADTALYGRVTYEMMEAYWPGAGDKPAASKHDIEHSKWYNNVEKVVISSSMAGLQKGKTTVISQDIAESIAALKNKAGKEIIIFGSPSVNHILMQEGLIDEYWLFVNPVLIGAGIPLFKNIQHRVGLQLRKTATFASGVVCLHYTLK